MEYEQWVEDLLELVTRARQVWLDFMADNDLA
jgi:hypothetical protein